MALDIKRQPRAPRDSGADLGEAVRRLRVRLNVRQVDLAKCLGLAQGTLSQYESGTTRGSVEKLIGLLRLATADDEREPILRALESYGIGVSDLGPALLGSIKHPRPGVTMSPVSSAPDRLPASELPVFPSEGSV